MHRYISTLKFYLLDAPYAWLRYRIRCKLGMHVWYESQFFKGIAVRENCKYCAAERWITYTAEVKGWPDRWVHYPRKRRIPKKVRGLKPKTAYEKRLWKPDAKLEED